MGSSPPLQSHKRADCRAHRSRTVGLCRLGAAALGAGSERLLDVRAVSDKQRGWEFDAEDGHADKQANRKGDEKGRARVNEWSEIFSEKGWKPERTRANKRRGSNHASFLPFCFDLALA